MIEKKERLIITFETTTAAMKMERACKNNNMPGRIISVPPQISAGCGLCYMAEPDDEVTLTDFMDSEGLEAQQIVRLLL